jgi:hypothetical protein
MKSVSRTLIYFQCGADKCVNIWAAQKVYVQSAWVTTLPDLAFYSILFCSIL